MDVVVFKREGIRNFFDKEIIKMDEFRDRIDELVSDCYAVRPNALIEFPQYKISSDLNGRSSYYRDFVIELCELSDDNRLRYLAQALVVGFGIMASKATYFHYFNKSDSIYNDLPELENILDYVKKLKFLKLFQAMVWNNNFVYPPELNSLKIKRVNNLYIAGSLKDRFLNIFNFVETCKYHNINIDHFSEEYKLAGLYIKVNIKDIPKLDFQTIYYNPSNLQYCFSYMGNAIALETGIHRDLLNWKPLLIKNIHDIYFKDLSGDNIFVDSIEVSSEKGVDYFVTWTNGLVEPMNPSGHLANSIFLGLTVKQFVSDVIQVNRDIIMGKIVNNFEMLDTTTESNPADSFHSYLDYFIVFVSLQEYFSVTVLQYFLSLLSSIYGENYYYLPSKDDPQ